jgi:hypothetical protein
VKITYFFSAVFIGQSSVRVLDLTREAPPYRKYVEEAIREGLQESPWEQVQGQVVLGSKNLQANVQRFLKGVGREHSGLKQLRRREWKDAVEIVSELKAECWGKYRDRRGDWGRGLAPVAGPPAWWAVVGWEKGREI